MFNVGVPYPHTVFRSDRSPSDQPSGCLHRPRDPFLWDLQLLRERSLPITVRREGLPSVRALGEVRVRGAGEHDRAPEDPLLPNPQELRCRPRLLRLRVVVFAAK